MSPRVHRTVGLVLIVASLAAAVLVQFLGRGLVTLGDLQPPTKPGPGGNSMIWFSLHVKLSWPAAIPAVLGVAALAWWIVGGRTSGPSPASK